jgi:hypothetical protein
MTLYISPATRQSPSNVIANRRSERPAGRETRDDLIKFIRSIDDLPLELAEVLEKVVKVTTVLLHEVFKEGGVMAHNGSLLIPDLAQIQMTEAFRYQILTESYLMLSHSQSIKRGEVILPAEYTTPAPKTTLLFAAPHWPQVRSPLQHPFFQALPPAMEGIRDDMMIDEGVRFPPRYTVAGAAIVGAAMADYYSDTTYEPLEEI